MEWIHENPPHWDATKAAILGAVPQGTFRKTESHEDGDLISGEWWRVEDGGTVVGYGWMDATWGDAEILLAVGPGQQGRGIGTFIMDRLEHEAASRGLNYMYNQVPDNHPDRERFIRWLEARSFTLSHNDRYARRVRA